MNSNNSKHFFNEMSKDWNKDIPKINYDIACSIIEKFKIGAESSVMDVACGTGILYSILKDKNLSMYIGIDISEKMLVEFLRLYPNVDVRQADFESKVLLEKSFDYIIIFNSIPHFNDLNSVFENAYCNLKGDGTLIIAHSKTREALKEHHRRIGYVPDKVEPIPCDLLLSNLSDKYSFKDVCIENKDYFCFSCKKK